MFFRGLMKLRSERPSSKHFEDRDDLDARPRMRPDLLQASEPQPEFSVSLSTATAANDYSKGSKPSDRQRAFQRLDVLHRHGRLEAHLVGWDGSPSELQPYFEDNQLPDRGPLLW